jgi:hypothetical protein
MNQTTKQRLFEFDFKIMPVPLHCPFPQDPQLQEIIRAKEDTTNERISGSNCMAVIVRYLLLSRGCGPVINCNITLYLEDELNLQAIPPAYGKRSTAFVIRGTGLCSLW